jgi:SAM-dependent methyltransferase
LIRPLTGKPLDATEERFHSAPRSKIRRARPWDRLAYINRALPAGIAELSRDLNAGPGSTILDYGCAEVPYRGLFPPDCDYIAADLDGNPDATLTLVDGRPPIPDASCDAVLSTQALEHVAEPDVYLAECARVLRPGGRLLLSTHGVMPYHPDPVDYWRWTCAGLQRAVAGHGFEVVRFEGIMGLTASGLQLTQDGVYWRLPRLLSRLWALCFQGAIAVAERLEKAESRRLNALVFVVVAERLP